MHEIDLLSGDGLRADQACNTTPIAIIGMGCRVPGADSPEEFWRVLMQAESQFSNFPGSRWLRRSEVGIDASTTLSSEMALGGFVQDGDAFDTELFGISKTEARSIDPQQGLLLEVAWQTFETAAVRWSEARRRGVGVYVGVSTCDYDRLVAQNIRTVDKYSGAGTSYSICANRISYVFGFTGPSLSLDTACSSSLAAIHLACESLRRGETEMALAGGVHLILAPEKTITLAAAGFLSAEGQCKCFSERADGYVRGEGAGLILLMNLEAAIRSGYRIFGLICGSAVGHSGFSNGLSGPSGPAQARVIESALARAQVQPTEISYVEAHGIGSRLGDEIEMRALHKAYCLEQSSRAPLVVGSCKGSIGHLEAAAGVVSVIKTAMMLQRRVIPATVGTVPINSRLQHLSEMSVATAARYWGHQNCPRGAGVSAFSFGGANAHIVMREPSVQPRAVSMGEPFVVLPISARSRTALDALKKRYADFLREAADVSFFDTCFTAAMGREVLPYRLAIVANSLSDAAELLEANVFGCADARAICGQVSGRQTSARTFIIAGPMSVDLMDAPLPAQKAHAGFVRDFEASCARRSLGRLATTEAALSTAAGCRLLHHLLRGTTTMVPQGELGAVIISVMRDPDDVNVREATDARAALEVWRIGQTNSPRDIEAGKHEVVNVTALSGAELAQQLARAFVRGVEINWRAYFGCGRRVSIPTYPFERRRYWAVKREGELQYPHS